MLSFNNFVFMFLGVQSSACFACNRAYYFERNSLHFLKNFKKK